MRLLTKDRSFYRKLVALAIPLALQNLINLAVSLVGEVMLGQMGEVAMSASALANQIGTMYQVMNMGLTAGASVLTSQYWGREDTLSIRKTLSLAYRISMMLALVFTISSFAIPETLMRMYTTEDAVIAQGIIYLRYTALTHLISGFTMTSMSILRTVGTVKVTLYMYIASFAVSLFFNYGLIFGYFGMPRLNVAGAAIATLIARIVECIIIVIYMFFIDERIRFRLKDFFIKVDTAILKTYFRFGFPVLCNEILWSVGNTMLSVVIGRMGSDFVAANSICQVIYRCTSVVNNGVGQASGVLAGNTIGEGKYEKAKEQSLSVLTLSVGFGLFSTLVTFLIRGPVIGFYNITGETSGIAYEMMNVMGAISVFQSMSLINMFGTLRGGGDSHFVLLFDVGAMWLFSVPLGWLAGLVLGWPVGIVYLALRSGDILKSVAGTLRIIKGKWIKDVTRHEAQEEAELAEI